MQSGLEAFQKQLPDNILSGGILQSRIEQRQELIALAKPTMNYLHGLMAGSGGVILLSDHQGVIVHSVGDPQFVSKADRVLLKTGASWLEKHRGTNAIGTALIERSAVSVNGSEHFLENNGFLSCTAAPIFSPDKKMSVPIQIQRNGLRAITNGNGQSEMISLSYLPHSVDVIQGDILRTSGIDTIYPEGLAVAEVTEINNDSKLLFAKILCKPIASIRNHNHLLVVIPTGNLNNPMPFKNGQKK